MKKQIPNIITLLNLFSGCIAIVMAFNGNFKAVVFFVLLAAVFDFLDGFVARLLGVSSKLGVELDSLADVVSFGVAPAMAVFVLLQNLIQLPSFLLPAKEVIPFMAFLIPVFSAYRLAKFNIDERQTSSFLGLPTPANALFWISFVYANQTTGTHDIFYFYLTLILIIALSLLMISELPMFSLKIKKLQIKGNEPQLILLALTVIFILLKGIKGVALSILAYIAISAVMTKGKKIN